MLNKEDKSSALVELENLYLLLGKNWTQKIEEIINQELTPLDVTLQDVKAVTANIKYRDLHTITPNSLIKMLKVRQKFNYTHENKCPICQNSGIAVVVNQGIEYGVACTCKGGETIYPLKYPVNFELKEEKEKKIYDWLKTHKSNFVQELASRF